MTLLTTVGHVLDDINPLHAVTGVASDAAGAVAGAGLDAISSWVLDGTKSALEQVARLISAATAPDLTGAWFSSTYWRVAGVAAVLTLPFLFAAMVQAVLRSDLTLVGSVVFVHLPLSALAVGAAAPLTTLLLAATDEMCSAVSGAAINGGAHFLDQAALSAGSVGAIDGSPFFAAMVGVFTVAAALMLMLELQIRAAAVYVVVLMLPLAFAAFVWPARRIWAVRLVELLASLILSKFVIVAVLSLAGSAFANGGHSVPSLLTAMSLVLLSIFAPWALLRILPFAELGAGAAGAMRHELPHISGAGRRVLGHADTASELVSALPAALRRQADQAGQGAAGGNDVHIPPGGGGAQGPASSERDGGAQEPVSGERDGASSFSEPSQAGPVAAHGGGVAAHGGGVVEHGGVAEAGGGVVERSGEEAERGATHARPAAGDERGAGEFPLDIDPSLHFNAGPGGWWRSPDEL